jgi:hypothetical protein
LWTNVGYDKGHHPDFFSPVFPHYIYYISP